MTDIQFPPPSVEDEVLLDGPPGTWLIVWGEYALREVDATGEHLAFISLLNGKDSWADFDLNDMAGLLRWSLSLTGLKRWTTWRVWWSLFASRRPRRSSPASTVTKT